MLTASRSAGVPPAAQELAEKRARALLRRRPRAAALQLHIPGSRDAGGERFQERRVAFWSALWALCARSAAMTPLACALPHGGTAPPARARAGVRAAAAGRATCRPMSLSSSRAAAPRVTASCTPALLSLRSCGARRASRRPGPPPALRSTVTSPLPSAVSPPAAPLRPLARRRPGACRWAPAAAAGAPRGGQPPAAAPPSGATLVQPAAPPAPRATPTPLPAPLASPLPEHPLLRRGTLLNGLRYVVLPNAVPPNRFEAHLEIHAGSVDEGEAEQGVAHFVEHVVFLGSRKREKLLGAPPHAPFPAHRAFLGLRMPEPLTFPLF